MMRNSILSTMREETATLSIESYFWDTGYEKLQPRPSLRVSGGCTLNVFCNTVLGNIWLSFLRRTLTAFRMRLTK